MHAKQLVAQKTQILGTTTSRSGQADLSFSTWPGFESFSQLHSMCFQNMLNVQHTYVQYPTGMGFLLQLH